MKYNTLVLIYNQNNQVIMNLSLTVSVPNEIEANIIMTTRTGCGSLAVKPPLTLLQTVSCHLTPMILTNC